MRRGRGRGRSLTYCDHASPTDTLTDALVPTATSAPEPTPSPTSTPVATPELTEAPAEIPTPHGDPPPPPTPTSAPLPTDAPEPTATRAPTVAPTPQPTSTQAPSITRDDLAGMVLIEGNVADFFPTLKLDTAGSGFVGNDEAIEGTLDPNDTAGRGRIDGYEVTFSESVFTFGFSVVSSVDLLDSVESAKEFMQHQVDEFRRFEGMEVGEGVTLDRFVEIDAPSVGTSARAGVLTASIAGFDLKLTNTFVAWTNGTVVAVVVMLAFGDEDRSRTAGRLATRMDQRIAGVLAGDIEVTPIGEGPTDTPEERALEEGFDFSTMIFTVADLPEGAVEISGAGYLEEEEAIAGYQRGFQAAPGEQVMVVGSSAIITIQANLELYGSPLDARTGVLLLRELDAETFAQETGAPLAAGFGVSSEDVTFSVLGVPAFGDATAGFLMTVTTEVGDFDIHLIYVAQGRIRAELVVFGGGGLVSLDDTVPLAELIVRRIIDNS